MKKNKLIVISGGMDSVTLLYDRKKEIEMGVFFDYGANHNDKEALYAKKHCDALGIKLVKIRLDFMKGHFLGNLLRGANNVAEGVGVESKKDSVIPFRNGIMLSIAAGVAESNNLDEVLIANHKGKETTLPDCSKKFIDAMNESMQHGTYRHVSICAPYTDMFKDDIIRIGQKIGVDYKETYSCYKGRDAHCGVCPACLERKESLKINGIKDLTEYEQ